MRKLIKYQNPYSSITSQWLKPNPTEQQISLMYGNLFKPKDALSNYSFDWSKVTAPKGLEIPYFNTNTSTSSVNPSTGSSLVSKSPKQLGDSAKSLIGAAPDILESGAKALGLREAEVQTGFDSFLNQGSTALFKTGMQSGNAPLMLVGAGLKALDWANRFGGPTAKKQGTDAGLNTGAYATIMSPNAGLKFSTFAGLGRLKITNKLTSEADRLNLIAGAAAYGANKKMRAAQNTYGDIATKNSVALGGGLNTSLISAKKGSKIPPQYLSRIKKKAKKNVKKAQIGDVIDDTAKLQNGGQVTNVIPEGALHARKNNYEGELGEQVTNKGIPVITYDADGKITQHAEIENSEIIFNLEVSKQLEQWFKEYKELEDSNRKSELEIECGKFLTYEILENTEDNMGLINQTK